jgi:hypothetical protein
MIVGNIVVSDPWAVQRWIVGAVAMLAISSAPTHGAEQTQGATPTQSAVQTQCTSAVLRPSSPASRTRSFDRLIDAVVHQGPEGNLPPRLSVVLGLTATEKQTPVKQAVVREGQSVRVFNVSTVNHGDLVILTHDEQKQSTKAYRVSAAGELCKAVLFHGSEPAQERSTAASRDDFAGEIKFWQDFSSHLPAGK